MVFLTPETLELVQGATTWFVLLYYASGAYANIRRK